MERWLAFRKHEPEGFSAVHGARARQKLKFFEKPFVSWRNDVALFMGPRLSGYSAVDVEDLTDGRAALAAAGGRPSRGLPGCGARASPTPS